QPEETGAAIALRLAAEGDRRPRFFGLPIVGFSRVRLHRLDPIPILDYIFNPPFQGRAHEPVSKRPARLSR
ncbi:hypothetical protein, partial [Paraeggerthella sp.]|uniref:hypothetical protein n=1 Tax=Paraeggerthella sp. TaxID=2897350 RepID=UPI003AB15586